MKIAFFSNFLNHHQLSLCQSLCESAGVEFKFVACERIPADRLAMGYEDMNSAYSFVVRAYETPDEADKIATDYDVVIFGAAPTSYLALRMKTDKLTFRFCERSLKKGAWRRFIPRTAKKIRDGYTAYKDKSLYVLGASAFASADLSLCGFPVDKCFKWGYFPSVKERNIEALFERKRKDDRVEILYAGRLLALKRVIDTLKAVDMLVKDGVKNLHLTIIGDGEERERLADYVKKHGLDEYVSFLPFMAPDEVREYMDRAHIYVFGSNFYEGWGAVVNEAMNSCCVTVVSHAVGSAAYLVRNEENGFVYKCGDVKALAKLLKMLVNDASLRERIGKSAYTTASTLWCASTAAERLLALCGRLLSGEGGTDLFADGPCAPAPIIKNNWIKKL